MIQTGLLVLDSLKGCVLIQVVAQIQIADKIIAGLFAMQYAGVTSALMQGPTFAEGLVTTVKAPILMGHVAPVIVMMWLTILLLGHFVLNGMIVFEIVKSRMTIFCVFLEQTVLHSCARNR
jgi:hypothetical protein